MSYIQIEIGGKLRGLKFNQMAVEVFTMHLTDVGFDASTVYAMMYAGLKANCYQKQEEPDFTFADVVDWVDATVDSGDTSSIEKVKDVFQEITAYKTWAAKFQEKIREQILAVAGEEDNKKKVKKKKPLVGS
jgi:hypothetical protein